MHLFRSTWVRQHIGRSATGAILGHTASERSDSPPRNRLIRAPEPILLAFATQTGAAEMLANDTRKRLQRAGRPVRMIEFYDLGLPLLQASSQALFIVSTTCDGDAPDMAEEFSENAMAQPARLGHLHYGLLALGDSVYDDFCGFGIRLDGWLRRSGAQPWFRRIDVDDEDERALAQWHAAIANLPEIAAPQRVGDPA